MPFNYIFLFWHNESDLTILNVYIVLRSVIVVSEWLSLGSAC
jgi:hypothetical protein